ncbi:MAG TPA: 2-oxoglutarate dehydrogenase complex dihydrolipoyllysine-residue succinyltransferase [Saprospiraceae bacterium]|nr:2-oxoglutarate dehydrogenase complex dihydrolipoyllysine-residue succinyltransferase [Saprospiraceae bacterium]
MSLVELKVPAIGESITEVTLSQWLKEEGDYVELDEPICEFESDKATLEFPAEAAGTLQYVASEGDDLEIGAVVAKIDTSASKPGGDDKKETTEKDTSQKEEKEEAPTSSSSSESKETYASGHPSPAAKKILAENDISPDAVNGTGKDGRITKEDAQKAVEDKKSQPEAPAKKETQKEEKASEEKQPVVFRSEADFSRETRREKMSRMRRTIAKRLVSAKNNTAMLTTFNEVDLTEVMKLRKRYQEQFVEKYGIKLGFMSLFAKACAKALMEMPDVNASIDDNELIYHEYADISIAISTPNGLVVPPVKNVESLNFAEVEHKIKELANKARDGKLTLDEMTGGTFTITNGGIFGSLQSTPILNEPQSAILGMHGIKQRPMAIDGEVQIRPMMYLALSYDHRVIDGSTSVTFLVRVKELLEDPGLLLLDL